MQTENKRLIRAYELIAAGAVHPTVSTYRYHVDSQTKPNRGYLVDLRRSLPSCECPDYKYNHIRTCKHILAVQETRKIQRDIKRLNNKRDDLDMESIARRLRSIAQHSHRQAFAQASEKMIVAQRNAMAFVAEQMRDGDAPAHDQEQEQKRDVRKATEFQIMFWWPDYHPENLLDDLNGWTYDNEVNRDEILVKLPGDSEFRPARNGIAAIRDYIEENELQYKKLDCVESRRNGRWEGKYLFKVGPAV